jgi:hypothetical protein
VFEAEAAAAAAAAADVTAPAAMVDASAEFVKAECCHAQLDRRSLLVVV